MNYHYPIEIRKMSIAVLPYYYKFSYVGSKQNICILLLYNKINFRY